MNNIKPLIESVRLEIEAQKKISGQDYIIFYQVLRDLIKIVIYIFFNIMI